MVNSTSVCSLNQQKHVSELLIKTSSQFEKYPHPIHNFSDLGQYTQSHSIYWKLKYICILIFLESIPIQCDYTSLEAIQQSLQQTNISPQEPCHSNRDITNVHYNIQQGQLQVQGNYFQSLALTCRSSAKRNLEKKNFMVLYRKPPSHRGMLEWAKIPQPTQCQFRGCNKPHICKYCNKIPQ